MEDFIFQNMPVSDSDASIKTNNNRLLLYVNSPCVVMGRNQNPWRECNVPLIKSLHIPLVRRRSGGGTVVHDSGNVNFSVMTRREDFTRQKHAQMIAEAVNELPAKIEKRITGTDEVEEVSGPQVKLKLNERYDIVEAHENRKVSGSAYKIQRQKAYHHGTMLLSSELKILSSLLSRDVEKMGTIEGRGVESVKSPVSNVGLDKDIFITTVINSFIREYGIQTPEVVVIQQEHLPKEIIQSSRQIAEYDWVFGQTPDFTHTLKISGDFNGLSEVELKFTVSKGLLKGIELESEADLKEIDPGLAFLNAVVQNPEQKVRYTSAQILEFSTTSTSEMEFRKHSMVVLRNCSMFMFK